MSRFARLSFTDFARLLDSFTWKRKVRAVHVHHTWRPSHGQWQGLRSIEGMWRFHTQTNGWSDIAQHVTIDPEGFVWTGRNWNQPPASARGFNGDATAGPFMFEVVGDFDVGCDPFGGAQKETVLKTTASLLDKFELGIEAVRFHNEMSPKSCPGTAIDRLGFFEEVRARRTPPGARARRTRADAEGPTYDKQSLDAVRKLIESGPAANEPDSAEPDDGPEAGRGAPPPLSRPEARGGLSAAERRKLRRHVINSRNGRLVASGTFATSAQDVQRIFAEHIREFAKEQESGKPLRLVFFAHGGLVGEESGLRIALRQIDWWLANGVYPVFFVWETGFLETLGQMLSPSIGMLPGGRGVLDAIGDAKDDLIETIAHTFGGVGIWSQMKLSAARGADPGGATAFAVEQLHRLLDEVTGRPVELHAVGHSAGSIFHSWFIPAAVRRRNTSFKTLSLLAPAIRVDDFELRLLPTMGRTVEQTTIFTMAKDVELADSLLGIYGKSLLYLICHGLEPETDTPILGLDECLHADQDLRPALGLMGQSSNGGGAVVWSVSQTTTGPNASTSTTHGGFDDDPPTMNAVLRRVLGLNHEPLEQEFTAGAREIERAIVIRQPVDYLPEPWRSRLALRSWTDLGLAPPPVFPAAPPAVAAPSTPVPPVVAAPGATGRRRALCIGINAYPTAPLFGCVADAELWARTLGELGFETPLRLADEEARRERILVELERLLVTSRSGDMVVFQYAGHGTQLDDLNGDETDVFDEAICPVDFDDGAYIVDDDFAEVFARIPDGVSLTCFFDCCHSGTNTRLAVGAAAGARAGSRPRFMRPTPEMQERHRAFRQRAGLRSQSREGGRSSMRQVVFAACRPEEVAWESGGQGDFTRLTVPLLARSLGTPHRRFVEAVVQAFGAGRRQTPELDCADAQLDAPLLGNAAAGGRSSPAVGTATAPAEAWARIAESVAVALRARP